MLTAKDIKNLIDGISGFFATKKDFEDLEEKIDYKFNNVLDKMDSVYKEVKDMVFIFK